MEARSLSRCLTPGCQTSASRRGVCRRCYARLERLVRKGAKWSELEADGLILPAQTAAERRKQFFRCYSGKGAQI